MFEKYTDIASEAHEINAERGRIDGVIINDEEIFGINVTDAFVPEGSEKRRGHYYTVDIGRVWEMDTEARKLRAMAVAEVLKRVSPAKGGCALVIGLGNRRITPDSIGPETADRVIVTRHLKKLSRELYDEIGFGEVASLAPGVLGQTGIESAELVRSVAERIKPSVIIAVDALASRKLSRLCTTVQISDTGISPGSGVENNRAELTGDTLGVPVIAVGLPTVVDAATLAYDLLDELAEKLHAASEEECESLVQGLMSGSGGGVFVTPKENDVIIIETARLIADGINLAFHEKIPYEDINEYRT